MFFHISLELLVSPDKEAHGAASPKPVFSFQDYKIAKGKQWNSRVKGQPKGGKSKKEKSNDVVIFISLMEWNENVCCLKLKRGKRIALKVPVTSQYSSLKMNAEEKWKNYHSNLYDEEQVYVLLYEDGQKSLFLPGGKEVFCLKKYQEELGKDYNRITLYLCTVTDYNISIGKDEVHVHDSDSNDEMGPLPSKFARLSNGSSSYIDIDKTYDDDGNTSCILQIKHDEELAKELEKQLNKPVDVAICKPDDECKDPSSVVKALEKRVDHSEQLSLVIRRGAPLIKVLSLWKREVKACKSLLVQ